MSENFSRYKALNSGTVTGPLQQSSYTALIGLVHDALRETPERDTAVLLATAARDLEQFEPVITTGQ